MQEATDMPNREDWAIRTTSHDSGGCMGDNVDKSRRNGRVVRGQRAARTSGDHPKSRGFSDVARPYLCSRSPFRIVP
jgi:hypothetical protein